MGYKIKDMTNKSSTVEPVQFLSSKERFFFFVEENRTLVWIGILLGVAVIVAIVALTWWSQHKQEQAWELEGRAQNMYLDRPMDDVKKGRENVQKASVMFEEIRDQFPGTASAEVSSFLLGNNLMEEGDYPGAIEVYSSFIQEYPQDDIFVALVQQRLGLAYLLAGNREAAMKAFEAVLNNPHAFNKDQVLFEKAKLAEVDENIAEAVVLYKRIAQEFPLSPFASESTLRVKALAPEEAEKASTLDKKETGEGLSQPAESLPVQGEGENK
jgi:TolA-binding protein